MKRKLKAFLIIIISVIFIAGCGGSAQTDYDDSNIKFVTKCGYSDLDDGWLGFLCIELSKIDVGNTSVIDNFKFDENTLYNFDIINLKYKTLNGYYIPVYDEEGNILDKIEPVMPTYSVSEIYRTEVSQINDFLLETMFDDEINMNDLRNLNIEAINKELIIELFNKAIKNNPDEEGKFMNFPFANLITSPIEENYFYQISYYSDYGNIKNINIEIIYNGDIHLSDLVTQNDCSEEQKQLFEKIEKIEKFIVSEQTFELINCPDYNDELELLQNTLNKFGE